MQRDQDTDPQREEQGRTRGEDGHAHGEERGSGRNQPCPRPDPGLQPPGREQAHACCSHVLSGSTLGWPLQQTDTITPFLEAFMCLFERAQAQAGGAGEGEADSPLNKKPDAGVDPKTRGS